MKKVDEWPGVTQEDVQQDLQAMFRGAIRASLEVFLEAELEALVGAEWYARVGGRRDRRNGTYVRRLLTSLGGIEVTVPRARTAGTPRAVVRLYRRQSARRQHDSHHAAALVPKMWSPANRAYGWWYDACPRGHLEN